MKGYTHNQLAKRLRVNKGHLTNFIKNKKVSNTTQKTISMKLKQFLKDKDELTK